MKKVEEEINYVENKKENKMEKKARKESNTKTG